MMENTTNNELVRVISSSGLAPETAMTLRDKFTQLFDQAEIWKGKAEGLVVTDISQIREMQEARNARLALRDIRIQADKVRKHLKEDSLRYGRAVQGVYNVIDYLITPIERHLKEQEDFPAIQEAKRLDALQAERKKIIEPYAEFVQFGLDLKQLSEAEFAQALSNAKGLRELRQKEERERIERERAEQAERERIKQENERLKVEAEQMELQRAKAEADRKAELEKLEAARKAELAKAEAARQAERKKLEAEAAKKLAAERAAREKIEAQLEAKRKAEAEAAAKESARIKAEEAALKKAKRAPDKTKLLGFAQLLRELQTPSVNSEEAKMVCFNIEKLITKVIDYIAEQTDKL